MIEKHIPVGSAAHAAYIEFVHDAGLKYRDTELRPGRKVSFDTLWHEWFVRAVRGFEKAPADYTKYDGINALTSKLVAKKDKSAPHWAYAIHYCMHASENETDQELARSFDLKAFDKPAVQILGPLFSFGEPTPQPQLSAPELDHAYDVELLHYAYNQEDKIPVLGRELQQPQLQDFLKADGSFLWLQLAGAAGQGKSRLAWELIQDAPRVGFVAGQMDANALREFAEHWATWQPDGARLIVVDYVTEAPSLVAPMMAHLIARAAELSHPVRLLLLERQRWDRGSIKSFNSQKRCQNLKAKRVSTPNP